MPSAIARKVNRRLEFLPALSNGPPKSHQASQPHPAPRALYTSKATSLVANTVTKKIFPRISLTTSTRRHTFKPHNPKKPLSYFLFATPFVR